MLTHPMGGAIDSFITGRMRFGAMGLIFGDHTYGTQELWL
jgi:hypothetical protein